MPNTLADLFWWLLGFFITICGFLTVYVLGQISKNQTELFKRITGVEGRLSNLEGAHNAIHNMGGR